MAHASVPTIDRFGNQFWFKDGKLHRDRDLPAIVGWDGDKSWWRHGLCHRDGDLPSSVYADGAQRWTKDAQLHRDIGPAMVSDYHPPRFYEHGVERDLKTILGETMVKCSMASWSPLLCFV